MRLFRRRRAPVRQEDAIAAMRAIRRHMAAMGYDLSDYTDEEIRAGVLRFGEVVQAAKFTMQEVADAFATMVDASEA